MTVTGYLVASLAVFIAGALWFSPKGFFPVWWRAMGRGDAAPGGDNMAVVFGLTIVGVLVQVGAVGWVLGSGAIDFSFLGTTFTDINAGSGLVTGLVLGIGVAAAASLSHRLFAGHGLKVWAIEVGSDVLNFALAGLLLGAFWN
jgi:hypothetical protein